MAIPRIDEKPLKIREIPTPVCAPARNDSFVFCDITFVGHPLFLSNGELLPDSPYLLTYDPILRYPLWATIGTPPSISQYISISSMSSCVSVRE